MRFTPGAPASAMRAPMFRLIPLTILAGRPAPDGSAQERPGENGGDVIDGGSDYLAKSRECLDGARIAYQGARYNNCANRSYYACFQAAIHALLLEGFCPTRGDWGHDFVQAQFVGQLINRRHLYGTALRPVLETNRELREVADYQLTPVGEARASRALRRAESLVGAVMQRQEKRA